MWYKKLNRAGKCRKKKNRKNCSFITIGDTVVRRGIQVQNEIKQRVKRIMGLAKYYLSSIYRGCIGILLFCSILYSLGLVLNGVLRLRFGDDI